MTNETLSVENPNLKPFKEGEERAKEMGQKGGSQSSAKKRIAAKIRELVKKHPSAKASITQLMDIIVDINIFAAYAGAEFIELMLLKDEALSQAKTAEERYRIQKEYSSVLIQLATVFYGKQVVIKQKEEIVLGSMTQEKAIQILEECRKNGTFKPPIQWIIACISQSIETKGNSCPDVSKG